MSRARLIDRVRALAADALGADESEVWLVLDHLADAMLLGRVGELAYAVAMEAPSLDEQLLSRLADLAYARGEVEPEDPDDPRAELVRRWNLWRGPLHVAVTLADEGHSVTVHAWRGTARECVLHVGHRTGRAIRFHAGDSDVLAGIIDELAGRGVAA